LIGQLSADIRFLPYRAGIFAKLRHFDGRKAASWVRNNSGIRVYDRGFRIPPYGMPNDDWIRLARDVAARRRDWDSYIAKALVPMPEKSPPASEHPALHLPGNHQVIGVVSLKTPNPSRLPKDLHPLLLQPSMDRQGFIQNDGYRQLYNVVRGGLEIMAVLDLDEELRRKKEDRKKAAVQLADQIDTAIEDVENSQELPGTVQESVIRQLRRVQRQAQRTEEAADEAEVAVETLGLLGVISAFMTHEMTTMIRSVSKMKTALNRVSATKLRQADRESFSNALTATEKAFDALVRHRDYVQTFASNVSSTPSSRYKARAAIGQVIEQFEYFTAPRGVEVKQAVAAKALAPPMPMSVYSGLILNLYTNALKAVLAKRAGTDKRILIEADNNGGTHIVRISDTGRGIPEALQPRVFDPLFSASDEDGPLGPGMGLGLYIVKRVVRSYKGKARLVAPPDGYATTFELRFKND
jgi:signal transduction histidine kinase